MRPAPGKNVKVPPGKNIKLQRLLDIEGDNNRGWQVNAIEVFVDDIHAGYIKTACIPHDRFKKHYYNEVPCYLSLIRGYSINPDGEWKKELAEKYFHYLSRDIDYYIKKEIINPMKEFFDYIVDKNYVDFIRLYDDQDTREQRFVNQDLVFIDRKNNINFKKAGLSLVLYEQAAIWLAENGFKLYASNIQSDEAARSWNFIREMNEAAIGIEEVKTFGKKTDLNKEKKFRTTLDGSLIKPTHLDWAETMSVYDPDGSLIKIYKHDQSTEMTPSF